MSLYKRQAVALAYGRHPVPMVTAKGEEEMALRILAEARGSRLEGVLEQPGRQGFQARLSAADPVAELPQQAPVTVAYLALVEGRH